MERRPEWYCEASLRDVIHHRLQSVLNTMKESDDYRERVFQIVRRIPRGRVMTYGQIAAMLGEGYTPRTVGFVIHGSPDKVPWHRVINARGGCSTMRIALPSNKQQLMLEREKVKFDVNSRCDLTRYLWSPDEESAPEPRTKLFKR